MEIHRVMLAGRVNTTSPHAGPAATVIRDTEALTFLDTPLGTRKAFANAGAIGLSVCELIPNDPKATGEITTLFERLFNCPNVTSRPRVKSAA
jgi:hypothetical protein